MPVYVDQLFTASPKGAQARRAGKRWCHLWADSDDELHAMAEVIGLKRTWFQPHRVANHYDLTPSKRQLALEHGAIEMSMTEWLRGREKSNG